MDGTPEDRFERSRALEEVFVTIEIEGCQRGLAGKRMSRICMTVKQFDAALWSLHERIVDPSGNDYAPHGNGAVRHAFSKHDHIGRDLVSLGCKGMSKPPERGDHFIEDQQNAMRIADCAQTLEIVRWGGKNTGRACHRLDDYRGNGFGAVHGNALRERVGKFSTAPRFAPGKDHPRAIIG